MFVQHLATLHAISFYSCTYTCSILFNRKSTNCSSDQLKGYQRNLCKLKLYWWPRKIWPHKKVMENKESFRDSRGDWPDQTVEANLAPGGFSLRYIGLVISVSRDKNAILLRSWGWKFLPTCLARHVVRKSTCRRTSFSAVLSIDKTIICLSLPSRQTKKIFTLK